MLINERNLHSYFPPLHSLTTQNFAMDNNSTSEQMIILGDDFAQNFQTKSFRCAFCKRGFSNAQALGGHMNIHRKDRAKLREFSDENLLSLEISKSTVDHEEGCPRDPSVEEKLSLEIDRSHDDGHQTESLSCVKGKPPRGLQLFSEEAPPGTGESRKVEYGELDLELRLGPEPNHHAKSNP